MHGIVAVALGQLRAGADWGAIAAEYLHGTPPATPLGQAEADFFTWSEGWRRSRGGLGSQGKRAQTVKYDLSIPIRSWGRCDAPGCVGTGLMHRGALGRV
jgi:hypothetical protein